MEASPLDHNSETIANKIAWISRRYRRAFYLEVFFFSAILRNWADARASVIPECQHRKSIAPCADDGTLLGPYVCVLCWHPFPVKAVAR